MLGKRTKGHRRQPGDEDLVGDFLAELEGLSTHKAEEVIRQTLGVQETAISHGTISRLRRGTWKGLTSNVRQAMRDFVDARRRLPRTQSARAQELLTVARYLEHYAGELRRVAGAGSDDDLADVPLIPAERLLTVGEDDATERKKRA